MPNSKRKSPMRRKTFLILALPIALAAGLVSSCSSKIGPPVDLRVAADTFDRPDRPQMTAEALDSEAEAEKVQDARDAWGKVVARQLDAACRMLVASGVVGINPCRPVKAEWE